MVAGHGGAWGQEGGGASLPLLRGQRGLLPLRGQRGRDSNPWPSLPAGCGGLPAEGAETPGTAGRGGAAAPPPPGPPLREQHGPPAGSGVPRVPRGPPPSGLTAGPAGCPLPHSCKAQLGTPSLLLALCTRTGMLQKSKKKIHILVRPNRLSPVEASRPVRISVARAPARGFVTAELAAWAGGA